MGQDDLGHLRANVHRLADVALHVQVLDGVLGDGAPRADLAVLGHCVTSRDLHVGGFTVAIASGDLHHVRAVVALVEEHRPDVKV